MYFLLFPNTLLNKNKCNNTCNEYLCNFLFLLELSELAVLLGGFVNVRVLQVLNFDLHSIQDALKFGRPLSLTGGSRLMLLDLFSVRNKRITLTTFMGTILPITPCAHYTRTKYKNCKLT